ncbi:MAG: hypothetical protein A2139_12165, partial [Desulfobacca sp. RBG_16_60_12]
LIVEHNLHGIDIDPRAVQIAALALWLRAQKTWKNLGIKAAERPRIARSNIVTAESMPGEEDMRREFITGLKPRVLGQLVDVVFEKMMLAGEAGSLLKIEEEIKDAVAEARKQWLEGPKPEQQLLFFPGMTDPRPKQQELRFDLKGVTDEWFWEQAEDRILDALKEYAERAESGHSTRRRLFAEDAARGFAFIDLCRNRYDAILMNPPFGEASERVIGLAEANYPTWNRNLLCALIDSALKALAPRGLVGSVIDRTAVVKTTYERFRREVLLGEGRLQTQVNLGWGVLDDANVEVAALISAAGGVESPNVFFDVGSRALNEKETALLHASGDLAAGTLHTNAYVTDPSLFPRLPNAAIAFDFPRWLLNAFKHSPSLQDAGCSAFVGHSFKSERHFRLVWEISLTKGIGFNEHRWTWLFNGGEYCPFYNAERDIVLYGHNGAAVMEHESVTFRSLALHGREGIGYGKRGDFIDVQVLPPGHVFTVEGEGAAIESGEEQFYFAALMGSHVFAYGIGLYCGQHKYPGYVNVFPAPTPSKEDKQQIISQARTIWGAKNEWQAGDETDIVFVRPRLYSQQGPSLGASCEAVLAREVELDSTIANAHKEIDRCFEHTYEIAAADLSAVFQHAERRPRDRVWTDGPQSPAEKCVATVNEMLSHLVGCVNGRWDLRLALRSELLPNGDASMPVRRHPPAALIDDSGKVLDREPNGYPLTVVWDGILVDDPGHENDIVRRVREVLEVIWKDRAEAIEKEACEILGVRDLRDYFRKPGNGGFWMDHIKRYSKSRRKAPIYWYLRSTKGNYGLWLYYNHLDKDILFKALLNYVEPKIRLEEDRLNTLRARKESAGSSGREAKQIEQDMDHHEQFVSEIHDFKDKLRCAADLHLTPDLNDGVVLNIAPLWRLVPWKEAKKYWEELSEGKYEWSSIGKQLHEKELVKP